MRVSWCSLNVAPPWFMSDWLPGDARSGAHCQTAADHSPPVAVRRVERLFQAYRACRQRSLICAIGIVHVDVQKRRKQVALAGWRNHHEGVADANFGWPTLVNVAGSPENNAQELHFGGTSTTTMRGVTECKSVEGTPEYG